MGKIPPKRKAAVKLNITSYEDLYQGIRWVEGADFSGVAISHSAACRFLSPISFPFTLNVIFYRSNSNNILYLVKELAHRLPAVAKIIATKRIKALKEKVEVLQKEVEHA